jgi:2-phospho-L-lactate/phosphoenolpyruvate guanylyltransferase
MRSLTILVPVKSVGVKSRLSSVLGRDQRRELARLLLSDVIEVLKRAGFLGATYVVSPDKGMLDLASMMGAHTIAEPKDAGVNSAVRRGLKMAKAKDDIMVIPADLPLLGVSDLRSLVSLRRSGPDVVISPSLAFDGTNALVFPLGAPLRLSYDRDSFWNHLASASREGLSVGVSSRPGIMFDVDSPEDLRKLAKSRTNRNSVVFAKGGFG